jgi:hypothetical protein
METPNFQTRNPELHGGFGALFTTDFSDYSDGFNALIFASRTGSWLVKSQPQPQSSSEKSEKSVVKSPRSMPINRGFHDKFPSTRRQLCLSFPAQ